MCYTPRGLKWGVRTRGSICELSFKPYRGQYKHQSAPREQLPFAWEERRGQSSIISLIMS